MPEHVQAIVLAGGTAERFQTGRNKLTEKICGKEMIVYPLHLLNSLQIPTTAVIGFQEHEIKKVLHQHNLDNIQLVKQKQQLGTGNAVAVSRSLWNQDHILLINGDIPLLTQDIIKKLYNKHIKTDADLSFVTAHGVDLDNQNYCRIVINENKIYVLEKSDTELDYDSQCCISAGIYLTKRTFLEKYIDQLSKSKLTGEYYLPELVQIASNNNCKIVTTPASFDTIRAVDTLADLWAVEHIKRSQIIRKWMSKGVRFANSLNVMIDENVEIEPGAYIGSGVHLLGKTTIKNHCKIGAYTYIKNSIIEESCSVKPHTVIRNSTITHHSIIPSFSYIDTTEQQPKQRDDQTMTFTGAIKTKNIDNQPDL